MIELPPSKASDELLKVPFAKEFAKLGNQMAVIGFKSRRFNPDSHWYMASVPPISAEQLRFYERFFQDYFGQPIKGLEVAVEPGGNIPRDIIPIINKMNGFLFMGILLGEGNLTLDVLAQALHETQGGCIDPPVNLGYFQELYLKRLSGNITELLRICPHLSEPGQYTVEYMLHRTR